MNPAKLDEPTKMPFGMETRVGPRNHVLDGDSDPTRGRDKFGGSAPDDAAVRPNSLTVCFQMVRLTNALRTVVTENTSGRPVNAWTQAPSRSSSGESLPALRCRP